MMRRFLMTSAVLAAAAAAPACGGGDDPPDPGPTDGGFQIRGPIRVADGADTYPVAIDEARFKVAYTSDSKLFVRELEGSKTLASNETIDRAFAPVFDDAWSRAVVVRAFDGVQDFELSAVVMDGEKTELTTNGRAAPAKSGDGCCVLYLAQGTGIPELWSYELASKTPRKVGARASAFYPVRGSSKVIYTGGDELHVTDALSGDDQRISAFTGMAHAAPGAAKILFYSAPANLQLFDALSGALTMLATDASEMPGNAEISADQSHAIFAREEITGRALYYLDTVNPMPERIFAYTEEARISRDGKTVTLWTFRGPANLFVWTGGEAKLANRYFVPSGGPRFDEEMKLVAYFSMPNSTTMKLELHVYDVEDERDILLEDDADPIGMRIASDGSRVAFFSGAEGSFGPLSVWDRASGLAPVISTRASRDLATTKNLSAIAFSEQQTADQLRLWKAGESAPSVIAAAGDVARVRFDPGERRIIFNNGSDLWLDVLEDAAPPALFAKGAAEDPVLSESLIAYSVRAGTSTASGVYVAPLP